MPQRNMLSFLFHYPFLMILMLFIYLEHIYRTFVYKSILQQEQMFVNIFSNKCFENLFRKYVCFLGIM